MPHPKLRSAYLAAVVTGLLSSTALSAERYSTIWDLGDSLSDTGRTYARTKAFYEAVEREKSKRTFGLFGDESKAETIPLGDKYYKGRFSNGIVWVEQLNDLNKTEYKPERNLAWGGATADYNVRSAVALLIPKFGDQNDDLIKIIKKNDSQSFGQKPLFTLWIGGNNFRQEVEDSWVSVNINRASNAVRSSVTNELKKLSDAVRAQPNIAQSGATYYVNTVPNIATTPKMATKFAKYATELTNAITDTNRAIKANMYVMQDGFDQSHSGERIVTVDAAALLKEVQARPGSFGFKNGNDNCVNADTGKYVGACTAQNVGDYLFWDEFHPTTKAHAMIADYAWKTDLLEAGDTAELVRPYVANIEIRDRTFAGQIIGAGSLIKSGESVLTLAGLNSYAGGTRIDNGTVRIAADANLGARSGLLTLQGGTLNTTQSFTMNRDVAVNASVSTKEIGGSAFGATFRTEAGTVLTLRDNTLSGSGDIAKAGLGTLDIRSAVTDARALTAVQEGTLKINATTTYRTTELTVAKNAVLGGSGTIIGTVENAGTLSPGNSIGTLTIDGDYQQAASGRILMEVDTDRHDALHANGNLTVGGDIDLVFDRADKMANQTFTFASSTGATNGRFAEVIDLNPFLSETLTYGPNSVSMTFNRDFAAPATTANQRAVAQHLNRSYQLQSQGDLDTVFYALDGTVTDAAGALALQTLGGEAIANATAADAVQRGQFVRALEDRMADRRAGRPDVQPGIGLDGSPAGLEQTRTGTTLRQAAAGLTGPVPAAKPDTTDVSLWARALGGPGHVGGRSGFDLSHVGVLVGVDKALDGALLGASFGYADGTTNGVGGLNRSGSSAYQGSVYGSVDLDPVFVDAVAAYTHTETRTIRSLSFGDLSRSAVGQYGGDDVSAAFKVGTRARFGALYAEPSLGLDWYRLGRDAFTERSAGSAGLDARGVTHDIVQPSVGVRMTADFTRDGILFSPEIRARYYHNAGDTLSFVKASLIGAPGSPFTTAFAGIGRDTGVVSAGLTARKDDLQVFTRYEAAIGHNLTAHIFAGGVRYAW